MFYHYDRSMFNSIDAPWKAYFLGWLFTDGNMSKELSRITLTLRGSDKYILDFFGNKIYGDNPPVRKCPDTSKYEGGFRVNPLGQYMLRVNSVEVCKSLYQFGLVPNKSLILKFPDISIFKEESYVFDFICGVFDGNGWIRQSPRAEIGIISSNEFISGLCSFLEKNEIPCSKTLKGNNSFLSIYGIHNLLKFRGLIYKDTSYPRLERKSSLFKGVELRPSMPRTNNKTSKYRGVCFKKKLNKYVSRATINGKRYNLGCYKTEEDAFNARSTFLKENGRYY
jgi:hypothetical protein